MKLSPNVAKVLAEKTPPRQLDKFRQRCQGLVKMSRDSMSKYYDAWDMAERTYRGERTPDAEDKKAAKKNEPMKVFVPLTHAQVQTFVSFAVMMMTQRDYFYELGGTGVEDEKAAKLGQAVLQRDLEYNKWEGVLLPQFLTDAAVKGLGVLKTQWSHETCPAPTQVPDPRWQPDPMLPTQAVPPTVTVYQEKTKYLGNRIEVVSPYRWFPDTRLPITRYREGEFCADESEKSYGELQKLERRGEVAGLQWVPRLNDNGFEDRRLTILSQGSQQSWDPTVPGNLSGRYYLITEVEIRCNPAQTEIGDGVVINPDLDAEVVLLVWIANDDRIIRIVDSGYEHNEFLYDAAQFFNDQSRLLNGGIAELLAPMQDIMDWLLNTRVTNVRKCIQNFSVVDPRYVNLDDLKARNPVVRTKGIPDGLSIDAYFKQFNPIDVTTTHLTDMANISSLSKEATGLQENLLGQYAEGRRSAREASNVNANGASRVTLPIKGLWESALLPCGRKMLANHRQGLDIQQLVSIVGLQRIVSDPASAYAFLPVDKTQLYGNYDFLIFDATVPSQRMAQAMALAQAGETMMKDPRAFMVLGKDPKLLFDEWFELMGIRNADRFNLTPDRLGQIMLMVGAGGNAGGAQVPPGQGGGGPNNGPR